MKYSLEVDNIKCEGCATKVKNELSKKYEFIEVDLEKMPRVVTVELDADQVDTLRADMKSLGYPATDESLSGFENLSTKAKSFISCASGKMDNMTKSNTKEN